MSDKKKFTMNRSNDELSVNVVPRVNADLPAGPFVGYVAYLCLLFGVVFEIFHKQLSYSSLFRLSVNFGDRHRYILFTFTADCVIHISDELRNHFRRITWD